MRRTEASATVQGPRAGTRVTPRVDGGQVGQRSRTRASLPLAPALALALALLGTSPALTPTAVWAQEPAIKAVYDRWCAACHGYDGGGDGPAAAYMLPRPRDFTTGLYQIKSTPSGTVPSDDDILRVIDDGMPGTAMPGWRGVLTSRQRRELVQYLKSFSHFFQVEEAPDPIRPGRAPRVTDDGLAEGREVFDLLECWRCHGQQGRGDGPSAHEQVDDDGFPIRPANLQKNWMFSGGGGAEDIFLRIMTGLEGTPMPSQADLIDAGVITEEQLWQVAQYVRSLSPDRPPRVRDVLRAGRVEGELPTSSDDEAWDDTDEFYFPLVGQIVVRPRWFAPSVSGVWVRALHNDEALALRLRWHDPSRSPEARWLEWQERLLATMEPREGGPTEPQVLPDAFALQFPRTIPVGMDRPYFLMGTSREPVYMWYWQSEPERAYQAVARGAGRIEPIADEHQQLASEAVWEEGEWRLVLRRPLEPAGDANQLGFETGRAIPIAFYAWDGDNSESGTRGAIGSWYYIWLDEPVGPGIYATPAAAMLLTGLLGIFVVARAQRRERLARGHAPAAPGAAAGGPSTDPHGGTHV